MFSGSVVGVSDMESLYRGDFCATAVLSFLVYDWMISLGDEVAFIWSSTNKRTVASCVYFLNRYTLIMDGTICVITSYPLPILTCQSIIWIHRFLPAVQELAAAAFATLRIYAVSDRNWLLSTVTLLLLLVSPLMALICDISLIDIKDLPLPLNCIMVVKTTDTFVRLSMISRGCSIAAELLVAGITWWNAHKGRRLQKGFKVKHSMQDVMLYDGNLYFVVLALLNVMQIIFLRLRLRDPFVITSDITIFASPLNGAHSHLSFVNSEFVMPLATPAADGIGSLPSFVAAFTGPVCLEGSPDGNLCEDTLDGRTADNLVPELTERSS
ncbi:hypothetical protein C8Q74DRAFT_1214346 [Fomes fomentarius]|nr:hypothetical protein C8Q74DRAFT_1214346 [Fomes fomentarius]